MPEGRGLHIHLDVLGGIAGDMFVAALLDAFPEMESSVLADIAAILPPEAGIPVLEEGRSGGLRVRRFRLKGGEGSPPASGTFRDMAALIGGASLRPGTAERAQAILRILAEAEARVHGIPIDDVHFHEIADWDSVMDVVAAASVISGLDGAAWSASDLPRGGGTVRTQHGLLPVPAPATAEILTGFAWRDDGVRGERVTPTGAAILAHLVRPGGDVHRPEGRLVASGMGAGTRELIQLPNLLRALVFEKPAASEPVAVIGFEIDDMTGEEIALAIEALRGCDGVLDAAVSTRIGKKGRPQHAFHILARPGAVEAVERLCFLETTTLGVRHRIEHRRVLDRRSVSVGVAGETVRVKLARRPDGAETAKAEHDDAAQLSGLAARRARRARAERRATEGGAE